MPNFTQKVSSLVKKHIASIEEAHDRRVVEAEARARRRLATARTKAEREMVMLQLKREKYALKQELSEAKIATRKAQDAATKARKEAGDLTLGERFGVVGRRLGRETVRAYRGLAKTQRPARKRRSATAKRRTVRR